MTTLNLQPFPILQSERLLFRQLQQTDAKDLFDLHADMENRKYLDRLPPAHIEETEAFIKKINQGVTDGTWVFWAMLDLQTLEFVGTICLWQFSDDLLKAEIGYELKKLSQGKGLATEAVQTILDFGFNSLKISIVEAYTHIDNKASTRVLQKKHFVKQKEIAEPYANGKGSFMMEVFSLERNRYKSK